MCCSVVLQCNSSISNTFYRVASCYWIYSLKWLKKSDYSECVAEWCCSMLQCLRNSRKSLLNLLCKNVKSDCSEFPTQGVEHTLPPGASGKYTGAFLADLRHGEGVMHYDSGGIYEGEWRAGVYVCVSLWFFFCREGVMQYDFGSVYAYVHINTYTYKYIYI